MTGSCSCGLLRYQLLRPPIVVHCCHCTSCQRETGSAFALNGFVENENLQMLPPSAPTVPGSIAEPSADLKPALPLPEEWSGPWSSNNNNNAHDDGAAKTIDPIYGAVPSESGCGVRMSTCPRCFICVWCLYGAGSGSVMKAVRIGTLDKAWQIDPDVHIYTRSKRSFISLQDGKPVFEDFYDDRSFYRPDGQERMANMIVAMKKLLAEKKAEKEKEEE
ncbi:uncharacterized protein MKZ38_003135 [Zalerion maritima]|uniref:CENP-V/GFA domain-containing protein n=1 Tax=Zalerion maritima TaxID=339359 RepID=A0AAD5RWU4_9PEZI|nr:uncharacterized protein MKZ38_003135 [Zalerion maritima]